MTPQPAKQYITDLVGEDYKNWHGIVVLDAGTNSGKTYFILKTLLPWAYERRKRILILCNREALRNQIERDVNRLGSIEVSYEDYDPALGGIVNKPAIDNKYEHTICVETYQWLETFLQRNEDAAKTYLRSFDYIVSDEYHYMVTDASFNDHVDARPTLPCVLRRLAPTESPCPVWKPLSRSTSSIKPPRTVWAIPLSPD